MRTRTHTQTAYISGDQIIRNEESLTSAHKQHTRTPTYPLIHSYPIPIIHIPHLVGYELLVNKTECGFHLTTNMSRKQFYRQARWPLVVFANGDVHTDGGWRPCGFSSVIVVTADHYSPQFSQRYRRLHLNESPFLLPMILGANHSPGEAQLPTTNEITSC